MLKRARTAYAFAKGKSGQLTRLGGQQHEKTADMLRNILNPFICNNDRLDLLINNICIELLGLTMLSMTGAIDEQTVDSRFERILSEIKLNTEKEK